MYDSYLRKQTSEIVEQEYIEGLANVIDGDSIEINGKEIRLKGIDSLEYDQSCKENETGEVWLCGEEGTKHLKELVLNKKLKCILNEKDKYNRWLAYCYDGHVFINEDMVANGYAVANSYFDKSFVKAEQIAKERKIGIWSSDFTKPWEWRKNQYK